MTIMLLFSFVMFGGGSCQVYDPNHTALLNRIEELENRLREKEQQLINKEERLTLLEYRASAKQELAAYADDRGQDNFTVENWGRIQRYVFDGVVAISIAVNKEMVDSALAAAKVRISGVVTGERASSFPSVFEEFEAEDFEGDFFENYTIIIISLNIGHIWDRRSRDLQLYTVFIEDGKINFLVEQVAESPMMQFQVVTFFVIISNDILDRYELGEVRIFPTYQSWTGGYWEDAIFVGKNCREWLGSARQNSIEHRAGRTRFISDTGWENTECWNIISSIGIFTTLTRGGLIQPQYGIYRLEDWPWNRPNNI